MHCPGALRLCEVLGHAHNGCGISVLHHGTDRFRSMCCSKCLYGGLRTPCAFCLCTVWHYALCPQHTTLWRYLALPFHGTVRKYRSSRCTMFLYDTGCLHCKGLCTLCPLYLYTAQVPHSALCLYVESDSTLCLPIYCQYGSPAHDFGIWGYILIRKMGNGSGLSSP